MLDLPASWRKPRMIFVNSMSDLFHRDVPPDFIRDVFAAMRRAHWHGYQILTKRSRRLAEISPKLEWPPNVWMGVTVENAECIGRIDDLRRTSASVKFVSFEPLLGRIPEVNLNGIDWVIAGGESGPGARPMERQWARDLRDQVKSANLPFFFKQWGGVRKKRAGRRLDGRTWDEMPPRAAPLPTHPRGWRLRARAAQIDLQPVPVHEDER